MKGVPRPGASLVRASSSCGCCEFATPSPVSLNSSIPAPSASVLVTEKKMAVPAKAFKKYTNPILGVSLDFPESWGFEESPSVGIVVFADAETLKTQSTSSGSPMNHEKRIRN